MEYHTDKMIFRIIFWLFFLRVSSCYPQNIKLPNLEVSSPEEVNSLEREEPITRSVNPSKENTIENTVKEVEEIIKSNPALPRLTRGEILDLLENLTTINQTRDPKAIMVVMPYTPTNDKNLEDLFTKAPVTHIIGGETVKEETSKPKHSRRRPPVKFNEADVDFVKKPLPTEEKKKYSATIDEKSRNQLRRKQSEVTTQPAQMTPTTHKAQTQTTSTTHKPQTQTTSTTHRPVEVTTYRPRPRRPMRRRTTISLPIRPPAVSSTSLPTVPPTSPPTVPPTSPPIQHPNHRYEEFVPSGGLKIIESPKLAPAANDEIMDVDENIKQEVSLKQKVPVSASFVTSKPKIRSTTRTTTTSKPLMEEISLPDSLKTVVKDLNLESTMNEPKISYEEQNRIKNLLASIGALPDSTTTTTTTSMPDAANVAESLSPDMRELLMSFGLLPNPIEKPVVSAPSKFYPESAEVKAESYVGFKPLPDDAPSRDDMDALLASFGLGRSARKSKAVKTKHNQEPYNFDMVPDNLKGILTDMGLADVNREAKKIRETPTEKIIEKQHVFNPDTQYATEDELKKLDKLIEMIRQIEKLNGTASEEDLKKIDVEGLTELVHSLNGHDALVTLDQKDVSPNPNDYDSGLVKNEVKRQEESTTASAETTTTKESATPSLKDLEASFGGETETSTEAELPETTTHIRTGFYYLVDWNSFLEIDDMKGKRVNLRFQPTIGDPKRFLSVSVP